MKTALFLIFCFLPALIYPAGIGFSFKEDIVFPEKSDFVDPVITNLDMSVFFGYHYFGQKLSFLVSPQITINENRPYIGFHEFLLSLYGNYAIFNFGKNNIYFGEGVSQNLFFPKLPLENVSDKYLYNVNIDCKLSAVNVLAGAFADTENIDMYKSPGWYDTWLVLQYSNERFTFGVESDVLFSVKKSTMEYAKLALEGVFLLPKDFNIYGSVSFLIHENNNPRQSPASLAGLSKYYSLKYISMTSIVELSYNDTLGYALYQQFDISNMLNVIMGIEGQGADSLCGIFRVEYFLNRFKCGITYTGGNVLADNKKEKSSVSVGIIYEYN